MAPYPAGPQSFIVRVWYEPREVPGAKPELRVVIEHVPTSQRRYLADLDEIKLFIQQFLPASGGDA